MLVEFDSLGDFARRAIGLTPRYDGSMTHHTGNVTLKQAIEKSINGDETLVPKALALIEELDFLMPETKAFQSIHSPFGGRVSMSDWLTGAPNPMRRRKRTNNEYSPLKIVVGVSCSAGITSKLMEKRGIVILALVLKLQQVRPINLYLLTEDRGQVDSWHYHLIRIESNPLALGAATFGLCSASVERQLSYTILEGVYRLQPRWPSDYESLAYYQAKRERLGLTEQDLLVKEAFLLDPLINNPMQWLKEQVARYTGTESEG